MKRGRSNGCLAMSKPSPDHLSVFVLRPGDVVIPLRDAQGKLWALQQIKPDGKKLFPKYGRKSGCYSLLWRYEGRGRAGGG